MRTLEPKKLASLFWWMRKHYYIDLNTVRFIKEYKKLHTVYKSVKLKIGEEKKFREGNKEQNKIMFRKL